jgi:hypothetical protein
LHLRKPAHLAGGCLPVVWAECPPAWMSINFSNNFLRGKNVFLKKHSFFS